MSLLKSFARVCLLLVAVHIKTISALVEPLEYLPPDLQGYLDTCRSSGDLTQKSARLVFWTAVNQYTTNFVKSRPNLSAQQQAFLRNTLHAAFEPLYPNASTPRWDGRVKRQAPFTRVRKEIRALTVPERRRFFSALNALKNDRRLQPNIYDFLAAYHSGDNIGRAHFGPAFPSWHRLYLWILEHFLRIYEPTVTIPYWASVLDHYMEDATDSVIFSPGFFGNGDGEIRNGPFRNWARINPQTSFTRNVQRGDLYTYEGIDNILRRRRNSEILVPTAEADSDYEMQHSAAHVFVGGAMNSLESAARDPIFFMHHCFVDQIWNRFRINQLRRGDDPSQDYPFNASDPRFRREHSPTANAGFAGPIGTGDWNQNLGYINVFERVILYEVVPACPRCANSRYLFCNTNLRPARCVSRTFAEMRGRADVMNIDSTPGGRVRRGILATSPRDPNLNVCPKRTFLNDVETRWFGNPGPSQPLPTNAWAYIPVKVVSKRPTEYHQFNKYSLYNQGTSGHLGNKDELLKRPLQKRFESCERYQDSVGKITVVAHGLNYEGYSEEYVIIDNRLGVAEGSGFIPVRMPTTSRPTEAIIAAFDSCGRVCKPYCKKGSSGAMVTDSNFSGGIKVSYVSPKQYSDSYTDALLNIWEVPSQSSCPSRNYGNIPVSFFCEYTDTWIWNSATTSMGMHRPGMIIQGQDSHMGSGTSVGGGRGNWGARNRARSQRRRNRGRRPQNRAGGRRGSSELIHPLPPRVDRYEGRRSRRGWRSENH